MPPTVSRFRERLRSGRPMILDAAMGTELQRRGADTRLPLWSARALVESPELVSAAGAAMETGLPFVASMVTDGKGRLLSGEPIEDAILAVRPLGPDAFSINCVPARRLAFDLTRLAGAVFDVPLAAYGNLGL